MKVVLLESLGVSKDIIIRHQQAIEAMGHSFVAYERTDDIDKQKEEAKDADVIMIANMPLHAEVIDSCHNLKYISVAFTGIDHVDMEAVKRNHIVLTNAAGYSTVSVAELTLCMMLSLLRNVPQVESRCRNSMTKDSLVGNELRGKQVGIIGVGAIGTKVAELCHAFGCNILGYKRNVIGNEPDYIQFMPLDKLIEQSDIITLHCPLNEDSKGLINAERISKMKKNAVIINTARGAVVDYNALAEALKNKKIAGAGIDVFEYEPPIASNHPLMSSPNTILTPHVAFATQESMIMRADIVFGKVMAWLKEQY